MKKNLLLVLSSLFIIIIGSGCTSTSDSYLVEVREKNKLEEIENGYILFTMQGCPMCEEVYPLIEDKSSELETEVYYFDIMKMKDEKIYSAEELQEVCIQYNIEVTPIIIEIKDGKETRRFPSNYDEDLNDLPNGFVKFIDDEKR